MTTTISGAGRGYELIVTAKPEPIACEDVPTWWSHHLATYRDDGGSGLAPIDRAIERGFHADRPAWAFASGYQEALRQLIPGLDQVMIALCATEEGGAHPRAILSTLVEDGDGWRLDGSKRYTTLGTYAHQVLVFASIGHDDEGRNRLALVRIPTDREGVELIEMPETPFVPEVPHAASRFINVRVEADERLPGDGYADYLKPFRTVEDIHVHAAILSWLIQVGRLSGWPSADISELMMLVVSCRELALADPSSAATHIALGGLIRRTAAYLGESDPLWDLVAPVTRQRWVRDRVLMSVAGGARKRRLEAAWRRAGWRETAAGP